MALLELVGGVEHQQLLFFDPMLMLRLPPTVRPNEAVHIGYESLQGGLRYPAVWAGWHVPQMLEKGPYVYQVLFDRRCGHPRLYFEMVHRPSVEIENMRLV